MQNLLKNNAVLIGQIIRTLYEKNTKESVFPQKDFDMSTASAVMFLLGRLPKTHPNWGEPCLILTKRSVKVKQPGDLCCPGGSIAPRLDMYLAKLMGLRLLPLARWPYWSNWLRNKPQEARRLALYFATAARESFEEIRLNPFGLKFLGLLPAQSLVMFDRIIYPLVVWTARQQRFYPNWEVEKVVYIPVRDMLNPENYVCYRLRANDRSNAGNALATNDFPCFRHKYDNENELLWGATYRITTIFLNYIFEFTPPAIRTLSLVNGSLDENYLTGKR
jgi:8-oxo-dGTP pyrophosphatase MutT (NUDIX family)